MAAETIRHVGDACSWPPGSSRGGSEGEELVFGCGELQPPAVRSSIDLPLIDVHQIFSLDFGRSMCSL